MPITRPSKRSKTPPMSRPAINKPRGNRQPLSLTLPPELIAQIDAVAAVEERSRAEMIEILLRTGLAHRGGAA